jgi:hypothetical protein
LDFNQSEDIKYYKQAIKVLEKTDQYNLTSTKLKGFLGNIQERADIYCWNEVLTVPAGVAGAPMVNMQNNCGQVNMAECTAHADFYMAA